MDAVLARLPVDGDRPEVTCRMAGDSFILLEYGPPAFDLGLNLYARHIASAIEDAAPAGITDLSPAIRSLLVGFDPGVVSMDALVADLMNLHESMPPAGGGRRMGRRVTLPIAFDDSTTRDAVARHRSTGPGAVSDIDDIVSASGLDDPRDVLAAVTDQRWCVAFVGYFPGLPFLLPVDGTRVLQVPKLERIRAWTAEGAVALGGSCVAIFPVEAPGSYRVFGRTVPIYALGAVNTAFGDDQLLLRAGDVVSFEAVTEDQLAQARRNAYENRYVYRIDEPDEVQP